MCNGTVSLTHTCDSRRAASPTGASLGEARTDGRRAERGRRRPSGRSGAPKGAWWRGAGRGGAGRGAARRDAATCASESESGARSRSVRAWREVVSERARESGLAGYPGSESVSVPPATVASVQENAVTLRQVDRVSVSPLFFLSLSLSLFGGLFGERTSIAGYQITRLRSNSDE